MMFNTATKGLHPSCKHVLSCIFGNLQMICYRHIFFTAHLAKWYTKNANITSTDIFLNNWYHCFVFSYFN